MGLFSKKPAPPISRDPQKPMSPTEILQEILILADRVERIARSTPTSSPIEETSMAMVQRIRALNMWLFQGGDLPDVWKRQED